MRAPRSGGGIERVARWQPARPPSAPQPAASASGVQAVSATPDDPLDEPPPAAAKSSAKLEDEEPLLGVVLADRYRVDALIGSGGMGLVYRATHLLIGRTLAIKVLRRRYAEQDDVAKRFALEARIASSVKHANVVDLIDYGSTPGGSPFYVMEYLEGRSLARELAGKQPLAPVRAIDIACQIARGLSAAHQAGVIHRDLKPDNVFLVPADQHGPEQAKILDFGIAHLSTSKTRLTAAGAVVGTPEYMSPEQARGTDLDQRSDLYALGIVLFEMLTGRVPLTAESSVGTLTKQVYELPPRLRDVNPAIGDLPSIEAAIGRLLAKNRDERPTSALDAARLLQTAGVSDLEVSDDPRARAALDGWSRPQVMPHVSERELARRSTIMIGSGSVTRAHEGDADQPATGSFSAKPVDPDALSKRPSVIVKDGVSTMRRPAPPEPPRSVATHDPYSATPTPDSNPRIGKPPGGGIARYLPFILLGIGAAIFAALVTIGLVRWLQKREGRTSDATDVMRHADSERGRRV